MTSEQLARRLLQNRIGRRSLLKAGGAAAAGTIGAGLLSACGSGQTPAAEQSPTSTAPASSSAEVAQLDSKELNVWTWGIYAPEFAVKSFEKQYGVRVNVTFYHGNEELWSKLQAGHEGVDIIQPSHNYVQRLADAGLIMPLEESKVPSFEGVYPSFKSAEYALKDGQRYSMPFVFGLTLIAYNTDQVSPAPDSWEVMWDEKYRGKIAMESNEEWIYATALLLGLEIDKLDQDMDAKLEQIKAKMREQKPLLLKNWESLEEIKNLLAAGDVWLAHTDDGLAWGMAMDGLPIAPVVPKEGCVAWADQFCILSDAPHKDAAYAWINHMFDPQNAAQLATEVGFSTVNEKANEFLDPKRKEVMAHTDEELSRVRWLPDYPPEIMGKIIRVYEDVRAG